MKNKLNNSTCFFFFLLYIYFGESMKVKIFDEDHEEDLESKINDFIEDKEIIDIKYSVSVSVFSEEQIYCFSALILYK